MPSCATVTYAVTLLVGVSMIVTGVVVLDLVFPNMFKEKLEENLRLTNGSDALDRFVSSSVPSYLTFYLFSVKNMDAVNTVKGIKPVLEEVGPFVFRQEKKKHVSEVDEHFGTIIYQESVIYFFEPEKSADITTKVNHINAFSVSIAKNEADIQGLINLVGSNLDAFDNWRGKLVEMHTAEELLFEGYNVGDNWPEALSGLCNMLNRCLFAFYQGKNNTDFKVQPPYEVASGFWSFKDFGHIKRFNEKKKLNFWEGACNDINGTDGTQFPPGTKSEDTLYVFSSDVCRSLKLRYEQDLTIEGISAMRFVVPNEVFADPNVNADNMCFCSDKEKDGTCPIKAGLIPLRTCQSGVPIMASAPHFYQGDSEYYTAFENLVPNKEKHQTYIDVEPLTGTVISAAKRIQINFKVEPNKKLKFLSHVDKVMYFPALWVQEGGLIDEKTASDFRERVLKPYRAGKWSLVAVIIVGAVALLVVGVLLLLKKLSGRSNSIKIASSLPKEKSMTSRTSAWK